MTDEYWEQAGTKGYEKVFYGSRSLAGHVRGGMIAAVEDAVKALGLGRDARVLELGCGDGWFTLEYLGPRFRSVHAFDMSKNAIERARRSAPPNVVFGVADVRTFEVPPGKWDAVFLIGILHHVPDEAPEIVRRLGRAVPNVVLIEPNGAHPIRKLLELTPAYRQAGEHSFTRTAMARMFSEAGYEARSFRRFNLVPNFTPDWALALAKRVEPVVERTPIVSLACTMYAMGLGRKGASPVIRRRETCRLCGGSKHELVLGLAPSPISDAYVPASGAARTQESYPLDLFLCRGCGHAQLLDVIDPEVLYRDYIYVTTSSMGLGEHFERYARAVAGQLGLARGARVVDIGSNDGTLLRAFKGQGFQVLGVEPARAIAEAATRAGIETIPEFFGEALGGRIARERGPAALVTMNNLFANVDDLDGVARGVRALLAPDGVFVFETFYFADFVRNMVFDFMYHEHLSYFTVAPLERFFARHGMELVAVERIPTKGGSIRCSVQPKGGPRRRSPSVDEAIREERALGIQENGASLAEFRARIARAREDVRSRLEKLKREGKRIVGYGASATSTTLIYHFGLQEYLECLVDDNPAKQGTLSPGCHLRVHPPSALAELKPDAILILAWRYWEPIVRKNADFSRRGGRFIVPLPEPGEVR